MKLRFSVVGLSFVAPLLLAEEPASLPPAAMEPPPPPAAMEPSPPPAGTEPPEIALIGEDGELIEPEVTIVQRQREILYEYRVNGRLTMVRVVPNQGPPYYFVDTDGDGVLDARTDDLRRASINQWVLFRW